MCINTSSARRKGQSVNQSQQFEIQSFFEAFRVRVRSLFSPSLSLSFLSLSTLPSGRQLSLPQHYIAATFGPNLL